MWFYSHYRPIPVYPGCMIGWNCCHSKNLSVSPQHGQDHKSDNLPIPLEKAADIPDTESVRPAKGSLPHPHAYESLFPPPEAPYSYPENDTHNRNRFHLWHRNNSSEFPSHN